MARLYGYRWQQYRVRYLARHPLCAYCFEQGKATQATVIDHIEPHRGDSKKFWDATNHQSLCKQCHDSAKQKLEKTGALVGCNTTGQPLDPLHHWFEPSKN